MNSENIRFLIFISIIILMGLYIIYLMESKGQLMEYKGKYHELRNFKEIYMPASPHYDTLGELDGE